MRLFQKFCFLLCLVLAGDLHAAGLKILLTNDDGYATPGIRALRSALIEAGHTVTLVGPAQNASGQSAAINFSTLTVKQAEPGIYAVGGTPATCVLVGVTGILPPDQRPDLIVSGINEGANLGVAAAFSGTVGATVAGLHFARPGIPGIAISTDLIDGDPQSANNRALNANIAKFIVRLVAQLTERRERTGTLLPAGIALNVNYPPLPAEQIKGVGIYRSGQITPVDLRFEQVGAEQWKPHMRLLTGAAPEPGDAMVDDDVGAYRRGYVTIVPITGDYTAPNWKTLEIVPNLQSIPL